MNLKKINEEIRLHYGDIDISRLDIQKFAASMRTVFEREFLKLPNFQDKMKEINEEIILHYINIGGDIDIDIDRPDVKYAVSMRVVFEREFLKLQEKE